MKKAHILIIMLSMMCFGFGNVISKMSIDEIGTPAFVFFRFTIAVLLFIWFVRIPKETFKPMILIGVLFAVTSILVNESLNLITASSFAVIGQSQLIFMLVLGALLLKEKVTWLEMTGAILCIGGIVVIFGLPEVNGLGMLFAVGQAFIWSYVIIRMKTVKGISEVSFVTVMAAFSLPWLYLYVWHTGGFDFIFNNYHTIDWVKNGLCFTGAAIVLTLGFVMLQLMARANDVKKLASFNALQPIFTIIFGYLILNEPVSKRLIIGCVLVMAGLIVANYEKRKKAGV